MNDLDRVIAETGRKLQNALVGRVVKIGKLLPPMMRGQEDRIVERAMLQWRTNEELRKCSPESFVKCVLQAAEMGFCLDGRLAYAVRYGKEATLQLDYKAMIAVAKRTKLIADVKAVMVMPTDEFSIEERDGKTIYSHRPDMTIPRDDYDKATLVYCVATHPDGWYRVDYLSKADIERLRHRSKAGSNGPWRTDPGEMAKKAIIRRVMKTFTDDPGLLRMLEVETQREESDRSLEAAGLALHEEQQVSDGVEYVIEESQQQDANRQA